MMFCNHALGCVDSFEKKGINLRVQVRARCCHLLRAYSYQALAQSPFYSLFITLLSIAFLFITVSDTDLGCGGTCAWSLGGADPNTTVAVYFEIVSQEADAQQDAAPKQG
jgi:hypothetical protein